MISFSCKEHIICLLKASDISVYSLLDIKKLIFTLHTLNTNFFNIS